ncbi:GHMP family kinase ATP-binding protein (plasmid) [Aquamicrobium terrae]
MTTVEEVSRPNLSLVGARGEGHAIGHHGELIQGVFEDELGRLHRGLVTIPLDGLRSTAQFIVDEGKNLSVEPREKTKALRATRLTLRKLGQPRAGGRLRVKSDIPIGHGYGSSTADVVASIRAAAAALGTTLPPASVSRLAVAAETASDATAFETEALLFAQREGEVLEHFGGSLPPFVLVGFKADGTGGVSTLELPPARYSLEEIQLFRVLRGLVARAVRHQDPRLLGRAATLSARISQRHLPKPSFDYVIELADHHQALGIQVAHSGSLFGLLLDPGSAGLTSLIRTISKKLSDVGFQDIGVFSVNGAGGIHVLQH